MRVQAPLFFSITDSPAMSTLSVTSPLPSDICSEVQHVPAATVPMPVFGETVTDLKFLPPPAERVTG